MQFPRRFPDWQLPFVIALFCLLIAAWGDTARVLLRYDRLAIGGGEFWRFLSGHFVHLGFWHLTLNLAGLGLVWLITGRSHATRRWLIVVLVTVAAIDTGFWFLDAELRWYVGLSGLLHGMLVAGAIQGIRSVPAESIAIFVAVAAKIAWEQFAGPLPGSEVVAGGEVVINAHLYGAAGGAIAAAILYIMPAPSTRPDKEQA